MSVAEFSIRRPVTTIMVFVSLLVIGLIAAVRLPLEAFPDLSAPFVFVQIPYEGSTPEEVERTIVRPVEEALATLPGVKHMRSTARADAATVLVEFADWDRDVAIAASDARQRIDAIRDDLPEDLRRYYVMKFSTNDQPVLRLRLASSVDLTSAYDMIDRQFKRRIERIPGVAKVEVSGAAPNEVEVAIAPDRLSAHGLDLATLGKKLQAANFSISAGEIDDHGTRLRVLPVGELASLEQLRALVVGSNGLRLEDIAQVRLKPQRMDYGRRLDGRPAVGLDIYKERSANLVQVSKAAMAEVEAIRRQPELRDVQVKVIENQGQNVTGSLLELAEAGGIGLALSVAVLFFFLRHWPSTAMVTLAIPICFVMTLGFMHFAGVTLNILTLMGLLLAVGMLVDNAVVVVESIYQERERMPGEPVRASIAGTRNVAIALSAGTLCHCIVFVPNLFGPSNNISIFMAQIAITICVSLLASWLVAVSLIPMLSARMKTPPAVKSGRGLIARMQAGYARLLGWSLRHRGWSVLGIVLVVALSVLPMTRVKTDMFGGGQPGQTYVQYNFKGSFTREQMSSEIARSEHWLESQRKALGISQLYSWFSETEGASTSVKFDSDDPALTAQRVEALRKGLPKSALADTVVGDDGNGSGASSAPSVQVQLVGDSTTQLEDIARELLPLLSARPELRDVRLDIGERGSELRVRVDRARAAAFGFSVQDVAGFVETAVRGSQLRDFRRGDTEVPVWVRFAGAEGYDPAQLAAFTVRTADGRQVPLMSMVVLDRTPTASSVQRIDRQTTLAIKANLAGKASAPEGRKAMEDVLAHMSFPPGYSYTFDGAPGMQDDNQAMQQMMFNLAVAVLMIYLVMAAVFESLLFPAAIMSGVVFSIFGVFWLFWITGTSFGVMAFIGILVLMGVVVNNGIVMVEHINTLRRRGLPRTQALVEGSRERLRPIMMTMGTAILAMVPIALSSTTLADGPPYFPMARAIAGGLAFSTVVSLLFLPTIYAMLDDGAIGMKRVLRRARGGKPLPGTPEPMPSAASGT